MNFTKTVKISLTDNIIMFTQDNRMHRWISSTVLPHLDEKFVAGENYEVSNFTVAPFTEKEKCFEADIHIILITMIVVNALERNVNESCNVFKFTNLKKFAVADELSNHLIGKMFLRIYKF